MELKPPPESEGWTYEQAGVSIDAQDAAIELIKPLAAATYTPRVLSAVGAFGGAFKADFKEFEDPALVASTDGVGTKVKLAARFDAWENVGRDLVAVSVNDIITTGATPLFFLDYIACHRLVPHTIERVLTGVRDGCLEAGCALLGGEMAEMADIYPEGEMDLAGFAVGVVDGRRRIDGSGVAPGDVVLALPSSGAHANGYTLIRRIFASLSEEDWLRHDERLGCSLAEELLKPTVIYYRQLRELADAGIGVKAIAHISGGGLLDNAGRTLPSGLDVRIDRAAISTPPIFDLIAHQGPVVDEEMWKTFNMGVGMTLVAAPEQAGKVLALPGGKTGPYRIGEIIPGEGRVIIQ